MKIIVGISFFCMSQFLVGQTIIPVSTYENTTSIENFSTGGMWITTRPPSSAIKGTPYLFNSWYNFTKIYIDNKSYALNSVNYNLDKDRFEARFSNDSVLVINLHNVKKIEIRKKILKPFFDPDIQSVTFFEEIFNSEILLLKRHSVKIREGNINPMTLEKIRPDEYIKKFNYYLKKDENSSLEKVSLKKSTILKLFDQDYKSEIKEYAKEENLRFKNETDLIKILRYYNKLKK